MARPRLGESERRRRTIGVRVTEAEETELLGQRVRSAVERRLGAAGAGAGTGGAPSWPGKRSDGDQDVGPGALVRWSGGLTACTTGGCRGRGIRRARSGWPRSGGPRSEGRVGRWPRWPKGWSRTATASIDMTAATPYLHHITETTGHSRMSPAWGSAGRSD